MEQIKSLLVKSSLTEIEQREFFEVLKLLSKAELDELLNFLRVHPEWIIKLYRNYKQKKAISATKNYGEWQKIFNEEEKELKKL